MRLEPLVEVFQHTDRVIGVVGLEAIGKPLTNRWVFHPEIFSKLTGLTPGAPVTVTAAVRSITAPNGIFKGTPHRAGQFIFLNLAGDRQLLARGRELARRLCRQPDLTNLTGVIIGNARETPAVLDYYVGR